MSLSETDPLGTLERYACSPNPETIPRNVHIAHTPTTLTIIDAFPKSVYHLLVLPRPREGVVTVAQLRNLRTLMGGDKARARMVLEEMGEAAEAARRVVEEDMVKGFKCRWEVWVGFHAVPSMRHVHLHVLSADLCTVHMKHKKHYNTFNPKLGFFLHYKDVMEWFDATPSFYDMKVRALTSAEYSPLLKEDLECFRCSKMFRTFGALKEHLEEELQAVKKRAKERYARELERAAREKEGEGQQAEEGKEGERRKRKLGEEREEEGEDHEGGSEDAQTSASASMSKTSSQATVVGSPARSTKSRNVEAHPPGAPPHKRQERQPVYNVDDSDEDC